MGVSAILQTAPIEDMHGRLSLSPKGSIFVVSDDLKMRQRDAIVTSAMAATQRSGTLHGDLIDSRERESGSHLSMATLQSQLTLLSQVDSDDVVSGVLPNAPGGEQHLVFSLLEYECAFKAEYIQGVERLADVTPVPNVAPWVRGVINLRGSIASVVDLRAFLDMEQLPYNPRTRLLSVHFNEMLICLVVDGVSDMLPIPAMAITDIKVYQANIPQWAIPYASGSALLDKRGIVLLDAARLLFSDKMQRYEALE